MGDNKLTSGQSMKALTERVMKADLAARNNLRLSLNARKYTKNIIFYGLFMYASWVYSLLI
jgi:hypothetical protein